MAQVAGAAMLLCLPAILYMSYFLPKAVYPKPISPQIDFDCQVFQLEGSVHENGTMESDIWRSEKESGLFESVKRQCHFFTDCSYVMGENRLELGQKRYRWNGNEIPLYDHGLTSRTLLADGRTQVVLLVGPHLYFDFGVPKSFRVKYNSPLDDGLANKEPMGFNVALSATRLRDGRILVPFKIDWVSLEKRGERSVLQRHQYKTELLWRTDRDEVGCVIPTGKEGMLVFWFRLAPLVPGYGNI
ncbi:TPA: hypothetical protein DDW35_08065 [Candidatus Sumerlaeota bacterium]|nr:hypothetical protein [Candidatus Sumerlaeota bacterium]